jgi:hypothetical protein
MFKIRQLSMWEVSVIRVSPVRLTKLSGPITANVCVSSVVRFRSRVLSPIPNVERRYELWATRHRTIEETFCCALGRVNRCLIHDLSQVVRYFSLTSPSPPLKKRWPCSVLLFQVVHCDMSRSNKVLK